MLVVMPTDAELPDDGELLAGRDYGAALWAPDAATIERARITHYARWLRDTRQVSLPDASHHGGYDDLWRWSVADPGRFWVSIWDYFDVLGQRGSGGVLSGGQMPDVTWFAGSTLNYARNALRHARTDPGRIAVSYDSEAGRAGQLSYGELERQVAGARAGLQALGVGRGDRVAAYLPNAPEALVGLLAAASLGAIWTAC